MPHQCVPSSQNQTLTLSHVAHGVTPSHVAHGEGAQPGATAPRALCLFPLGQAPSCRVVPPLWLEPGLWHRPCHAPRLWQPSFLGDRNTELGFRWSVVGKREPSAGTVSTNLAMPLALLPRAGARFAVEMLVQGPGASALQPRSTSTQRPPSRAVGAPKTGLGGTFPGGPKRVMLGAWFEGQGSAARLAGSRIPQEPALQELTDLNSPDFFPYLFSRRV